MHIARWVKAHAISVCMWSLIVNVVMLVGSSALWVLARITGWVNSVAFVSDVSMLALVFSASSGVASALAGFIALVPTDDLVD